VLWLSLYNKVQLTCTSSTLSHYHSITSCFINIQNSLSHQDWLIQVSWKKRPMNQSVTFNNKISLDLPRHAWSLMNCLRTGQGPRCANLHKVGTAKLPSCDCGQRQTMNHTVDTGPLTKFYGRLNLRHKENDNAMAGIYSDCSNRKINK